MEWNLRAGGRVKNNNNAHEAVECFLGEMAFECDVVVQSTALVSGTIRFEFPTCAVESRWVNLGQTHSLS